MMTDFLAVLQKIITSEITQGSAASNLEIEVKCKFPDKQQPNSQ
ncbi:MULTISPECIES: hypothetical protein [unclassified Nostoc]|nr:MULTISPECIES: hypothetical protein [unclassified Nostoc]